MLELIEAHGYTWKGVFSLKVATNKMAEALVERCCKAKTKYVPMYCMASSDTSSVSKTKIQRQKSKKFITKKNYTEI